MKVSEDRYRYSKIEGDKAEVKFINLMKLKGHKVVKASPSDDIYKHIDYYINKEGVDVKGNRHLNCIWLEITNVLGNKGWLRGEAKYIVFDIIELNSFSVFKTVDLLKYVDNNITEKTNDKRDFNKFYTRSKWNKKDVLIKVRYSDIKNLEVQRLKY
jgi:hypothetical protein